MQSRSARTCRSPQSSRWPALRAATLCGAFSIAGGIDVALHSIEICAGVGMLGEGARAGFELLGIDHRTVCYVEREAPAAAQLARLMEAGALDPAPVWSDLLTFDGPAWRGCVDGLIAGFPCQDISIAGRRAGLDGKRSGLFFDILDVADACGAWFLVLENVSAIATATATAVDEAEGTLEERAAARVVGELADRGWDAEWITLSASDVGASHGRARWFCLAWRRDVDHAGRMQWRSGHEQDRSEGAALRSDEAHDRIADRGCVLGRADVAYTGHGPRAYQPINVEGGGGSPHHRSRGEALDDPDCAGLATVDGGGRVVWIVADPGEPRLPNAEQSEPGRQGRWIKGGAAAELCGAPLFAPGPIDPRWPAVVANRPDLAPAVEPGVRMLADGMAYLVDESRAHQLRQVGNGVVPLQAAVALVELVRRSAR
ncbi:MAG: DNA cytosine methyltransferase [Comamonadaceae bacterium]|nr:MAG: DNA cytosine methyltransferase [Comamonadaceae bacterium]